MKKLFTLFFLLTAFYFTANATPFITKWDLSIAGGGPTQIKFKVLTTGPVNYTWETVPAGSTGTGSFNQAFLNTVVVSGFPTNSVIRLTIDSANMKQFATYNLSDANRLIDIEEWGTTQWSSMEYAFEGCSNMISTATDVPDLSNVTDMKYMFYNASSYNSPIGNWDVSNITNMAYMFYNAGSFNQPIGNWDVSNVTNTSLMFKNASSFNTPIGNWDVSNVTSMNGMFENATTFNQPIGNWNVSNVTTMIKMFWEANSFNQPIGNWDVSNVYSMFGMFYHATSFNQPIGNWDLSNVTIMGGMLDSCGMDCSSYSQTLNGWANNPNTPGNIVIAAGGKQFGTNVVADRDYLINTKFWSIYGDIASTSACLFAPTSINNVSLEKLTISPNPAANTLLLKPSDSYQIKSYEIYNIQGLIVTKQTMYKTNAIINISDLANGIYVLKISDGITTINSKFTKQ